MDGNPILAVAIIIRNILFSQKERAAKFLSARRAVGAKDIDLLIIRTQEDEATLALGMSTLANSAISVIYSFLDVGLTVVGRWGLRTYFIMFLLLLFGGGVIGLIPVIIFLFPLLMTRNTIAFYPVAVILSLLLFSFVYKSVLRVAASMLVTVLNCAFGRDAFRWGVFLRVSTEAAPPGTWTVRQQVYRRAGAAFLHGRPYDDPQVHNLIIDWIRVGTPAQ